MNNIILILIVLLAIGASAYLWYSYASTGTTAAVQRTSTQSGTTPEMKDLLDVLKILQTIKIDYTYLQDPNFKSLIDFSPVLAEPTVKGRPNPFLPASGSNAYIVQ